MWYPRKIAEQPVTAERIERAMDILAAYMFHLGKEAEHFLLL